MTTEAIRWEIPPSVLRWLERAPNDRPVAMLIRHSVRDHLPPGDAGYRLPITEVGVRLARALGARLGARLRTLRASPLVRCVQTAEALAEGAGLDLEVAPDHHLGDPGGYLLDGERAWVNWQRLGHEEVMTRLVGSERPLAGMAAPEPAARLLVQRMLAAAEGRPGLHAFVTHDSLVTATAARLLGEPLGTDAWPWYLEAAFFWREGGGVRCGYRGWSSLRPGPLCSLSEGDVLALARRLIADTVGLDCDARFFLAGGAFKTLLTGRPPRDLDLWAPSDEDRERLLQTLRARGASPLEARPFGEAFRLRGHTVEVPFKVAPTTLEGRLGRFDLALSAVGVEHRPGGDWRAVIHPLAEASAARREVLLLKPLVNWKYALTTLERARRYADELGFALPEAEEAEVWRVFEAQDEPTQHRMLTRLDRSSRQDRGVREEAMCRLR